MMKSPLAFFTFKNPRKHQEMAYLNGAKNLTDLEYRMRQVDNGLFQQTHFVID